MSNPIKHTFKFADGGVHDASVTEASIGLPICFKYEWSIVPKGVGLDQAPVYTIEVSDDGVTWFPYDTPVVDAAIDQPFDDNHLSWTNIRINYDKKTNTAGTVQFDLTLKPA